MTTARDKFRIRFRKGGDLRLVSHHDLMRCFERMLRRAELPFHSTQGYNPKPRLVFALSLGLGIVGEEEVAELELDEPLPPAEVEARLVRQAPPGLEIRSVRRVPPKAGAQVRRVAYRIAVPPDRRQRLAERCRVLLTATECPVHRTRPRPRDVDVRPYLLGFEVTPDGLAMTLRVTPTGTARPDEVLGLLGLGDLLEQGFVLARTSVELEDECPESEAPPSDPAPTRSHRPPPDAAAAPAGAAVAPAGPAPEGNP